MTQYTQLKKYLDMDIVWWHNWYTDLCENFSLHFDTSFSSTYHYCLRFTRFIKKWRNPTSCKLQRSRQGKLQRVFTTHARNQGYWSLHHGYTEAGYSTVLITAPCSDKFIKGYSIAACVAMWLSNSPRVIFFICDFSDCVIFHKLVSNVDNSWSVNQKLSCYFEKKRQNNNRNNKKNSNKQQQQQRFLLLMAIYSI